MNFNQVWLGASRGRLAHGGGVRVGVQSALIAPLGSQIWLQPGNSHILVVSQNV